MEATTRPEVSTGASQVQWLDAVPPSLYLIRFLVTLLELLVVLLADIGGLALDVEAGRLRLSDVYTTNSVFPTASHGALLALIDPTQCYQEIPASPLK